MNLGSSHIKIIFGTIYLLIIASLAFFLLSLIDIGDLTSYEFIRSKSLLIKDYKSNHFIFFVIIFFLFCIMWALLLGFAFPILIFSGFVFGKWLGILIIITSTTIGATLFYILARYFFRDLINQKFSKKFSYLNHLFHKNDLMYFMGFRFIGGGGTPYVIQNFLPILFNMSIKNYFIATFFGCVPSMFIIVAIGSGLGSFVDQNNEINYLGAILSPEIYIPLIAFFAILIVAFILNKIYFKE